MPIVLCQMKHPMLRITAVNSLRRWAKQQQMLYSHLFGKLFSRATPWNSTILAPAAPMSPTGTTALHSLSSGCSNKASLPQTALSGAAVVNARWHRSTTSSSAAGKKRGSVSQPPIGLHSWCCLETLWIKPFSMKTPFWTWQVTVPTASCVALLTSSTFTGASALLSWRTELSSQAAAGGWLEILIPKQMATILVLIWNEDAAYLGSCCGFLTYFFYVPIEEEKAYDFPRSAMQLNSCVLSLERDNCLLLGLEFLWFQTKFLWFGIVASGVNSWCYILVRSSSPLPLLWRVPKFQINQEMTNSLKIR